MKPCPNDTNGDGDCGKPLCPICGDYPQIHKDLKELQRKAKLYDIIRTFPPYMFSRVFERGLKTGERFDDLVEIIDQENMPSEGDDLTTSRKESTNE